MTTQVPNTMQTNVDSQQSFYKRLADLLDIFQNKSTRYGEERRDLEKLPATDTYYTDKTLSKALEYYQMHCFSEIESVRKQIFDLIQEYVEKQAKGDELK